MKIHGNDLVAMMIDLPIRSRALKEPPHRVSGNLGSFFQILWFIRGDTPLRNTAVNKLGMLDEHSSLFRVCSHVALLPEAALR